MIYDEEDAGKMLDARIDSGEWWIFIGSSDALSEIEEQFYSGAASADFTILLGPPVGQLKKFFPGETRLLPITFAHKRRVSAEQLAAFVNNLGRPVTASDLEQRDIIWLLEEGDS
jgi:hypothetical protein